MLLMLANTTDKIQLVTDAAVNVDVVVSFSEVVKATGVAVNAGDRQLTAISTATTTDILAAPASSNVRKLKGMTARNKSTTTSVAVTVVLDANGTDYELHKATLKPGECLEFLEGIGFFILGGTVSLLVNQSTAQQGAGFSSDTYLTGSNIVIPNNAFIKVGTLYRLIFDVAKTGAGTATPIVQIRIGANGTTGDTSRVTFTWGAGTAAVDVGVMDLRVLFRSVSASGVLQGQGRFTTNLTTTGLSNAVKALQVTASAFDNTALGGLHIGASYNGGASASHTVQLVRAELVNP